MLKWPFYLWWDVDCLPKVVGFVWLSIKDKILDGMRLDRLGVTSNFLCVLCEKFYENFDHLLLQCEFSQEIWERIQRKIQWNSLLQDRFLDHFQIWPTLFPSSTFSCIWKEVPSIVVWNIWLERNARIFKKHEYEMW